MNRYPDVPGAKADGTSQDAAEHAAPTSARLRGLTLREIHKSKHGLTADEAAERLGLSLLSIRPRVTELKRLGEIEDSGVRRKNESGRKATVWRMKWRHELF